MATSTPHERPQGHVRRGVCRCVLYPASVVDDGDVVMHEQDCSFNDIPHQPDPSPHNALDEEPRAALSDMKHQLMDQLMKLMTEKNADLLQRFLEVEEDRKRAEVGQRAICLEPGARREAVVGQRDVFFGPRARREAVVGQRDVFFGPRARREAVVGPRAVFFGPPVSSRAVVGQTVWHSPPSGRNSTLATRIIYHHLSHREVKRRRAEVRHGNRLLGERVVVKTASGLTVTFQQ